MKNANVDLSGRSEVCLGVIFASIAFAAYRHLMMVMCFQSENSIFVFFSHFLCDWRTKNVPREIKKWRE